MALSWNEIKDRALKFSNKWAEDQTNYDYSKIESSNKLNLILDGIQDPGNLGTIIRLADWFGIENIFCSNDTVDVYS